MSYSTSWSVGSTGCILFCTFQVQTGIWTVTESVGGNGRPAQYTLAWYGNSHRIWLKPCMVSVYNSPIWYQLYWSFKLDCLNWKIWKASHSKTHPIKPGSHPANHLTSQPTGEPTSQPTDQPTSLPNSQPTNHPTSQPTQNQTYSHKLSLRFKFLTKSNSV